MRGLLWFLIGCTIGGFGVFAADSYAVDPVPAPRVNAGTFDRVVWQGPDGFARQIGKTNFLYFEPFQNGAGSAARSTTTAVTVAGDIDLHRTRNMTAQAIARAGRIAARASGPVALAVTGLELAMWFSEEQGWTVPDDSSPHEPGAGTWRLTIGSQNYFGTSDYLKTVADDYAASTGHIPQQSWTRSGSPQFGELSWYRWYLRPGVSTLSLSIVKIAHDCPADYTEQGGVCVPLDPPTRPATDQDIEDAIYTELVARGMGSELARHLISLGYIPDMEPMEVSGPTSLVGPTTTSTTTGPDGTTTQQRQTTYDLSYSGDTVTVTPTTTTTTTTPDGTTTETSTQTPGGGSTVPPTEDLALCEEYPTISACQELGQTDDDQELPEEERDLEWEKELTAAGSCPAPIPLTIRGNTYSFSYEPACIGANYLRPIIIGLAWLTAGIFLFSTVKQS